MADIIDLNQKRMEGQPHVAGEAFCMNCNHVWTGVWPIGTIDLECPSCHSMRGRTRYDIAPPKGQNVWTCVACDNQLFNLLSDKVHCPGCGKEWTYEEIFK